MIKRAWTHVLRIIAILNGKTLVLAFPNSASYSAFTLFEGTTIVNWPCAISRPIDESGVGLQQERRMNRELIDVLVDVPVGVSESSRPQRIEHDLR